MGNKHKRLEELVNTSDNWFPNYPNNQVLVSLITNPNHLIKHYKKLGKNPFIYRVCVWGLDDFGMEKDFYNSYDRTDALKLFNKLVESKDITKTLCKQLGLTDF